MKKNFVNALVVMIVLVISSGCGNKATPAVSTGETPTAEGGTVATSAVSTGETPTVEGGTVATPAVSTGEKPTAEGGTVEKVKPIIVAFAYASTVSEPGWAYTHEQARLAIENHFGDRVKTIYAENVPYSAEASRTMEQFIADGASMIFATTTWGDFTNTVAQAHPEVAFVGSDAYKYANERMVWVEVGKAYYLLGVAAGLLTKSNNIGFVGPFAQDFVNSWATAFHMGAVSVNPNVVTHVVTINSYYDPAAEKQAVEALVSGGSDVIMGDLTGTTLNTAEELGVWSMGGNTDMSRYAGDHYVNSWALNWSDFYIEQVQELIDGTWKGDADKGFSSTIILPIGKGVDIGSWGPHVPQDVIDKVEEIRKTMIENGYDPFVGPIVDRDGKVIVAKGGTLDPLQFFFGFHWTMKNLIGIY
jgi:basic membrane lipoprotein Med (substrate-binding protein (PBP1-ABC) superfamily)